MIQSSSGCGALTSAFVGCAGTVLKSSIIRMATEARRVPVIVGGTVGATVGTVVGAIVGTSVAVAAWVGAVVAVSTTGGGWVGAAGFGARLPTPKTRRVKIKRKMKGFCGNNSGSPSGSGLNEHTTL